jgi:hypothetical protein
LDTIRRYAAERLDADGERAAALVTHASYYHLLALRAESALVGSQQGLWQDRLSFDHDNLRLAFTTLRDTGGHDRALEMLIALRRYWFIRANLVEMVATFGAALRQADSSVPRGLLGRALAAAAFLATPVDLDASWRWGQAAVEIARASNDEAFVVEALVILAQTALLRRHPDESLATEALAVARRVGIPWLIGQALSACGFVYLFSDSSRAVHYYRECISATAASGDLLTRMGTAVNLAMVYTETGELGLAHAMCEAAIRCQEELGYDDSVGHAVFAEILMREGDLRSGFDRLMVALRMPQNSPYQSGSAIGIAAFYAFCVNAWETAAILFGFSDEILRKFGTPFTEFLSETGRADLSVLQARLGGTYYQYHEQGRTLTWEAALGLISELGDPTRRAESLNR